MAATLVLLALALARQSTDLTFVRHGETIANATGKYSSGALNAFSAKGSKEVAALTRQLLADPPFAQILVSPSPRALRTIAPYLRATHRRATVWPLLYECCTGRRPKDAHPTSFRFGAKIKIPADLTGLFVIETGHDRLPDAPEYDAGLAQVEAAVVEFRTRDSGHRILLVGHSGQGGHFLHALTGKWHKLDNAAPFRVLISSK